MKINLLGVNHADKKYSIRYSSEDLLGDSDVDAVFLEEADDVSATVRIKAFLQNPSVVVFMYLYWLFGRIYALTKNVFLERRVSSDRNDGVVAEDISKKYEIRLYPVDKPLEEVILAQNWRWTILSWGVLVYAIDFFFSRISDFYSPIGLYNIQAGLTTLNLITSFLIYLFIVLGVLVFLPFIRSTVSLRNTYMLENIQEISRKNDYEDVLLITGKDHIDNFESLISLTSHSYETEIV